METNVSKNERLISGVGGGLLALSGLRRGGPLGLLLAAAGGYLVFRAASGHDPAYAAAGMNTASGAATSSKPIFVEHSVVVARPAKDVYAYWRKLENLPQHHEPPRKRHGTRRAPFALGCQGAPRHARGVGSRDRERQAGRAHRLALPAGCDGGQRRQRAVREPADGSTRVHVALSYRPPAGQLGAAVAKLFGEEPSQQIADDPPELQGGLRGRRDERRRLGGHGNHGRNARQGQ
jgi:uncharacterized membrane protein